MNYTYKIKRNLIYNLNNTLNFLYSLRYLENNTNYTNINKTRNKNNDFKKKQMKELYIYIGALAALIVLILGGYALYRKYVENKLMKEIEEENQMVLNMENSSSSSSQENQSNKPYSCNNGGTVQNQYSDSEMRYQNAQNYSYDLNLHHEERMENIRKKYGNSLLIKILIKKIIEEVVNNKTFQEEYEDNCTICMENFKNNAIICKTPCEHFFHKECFNKFLKNIKDKDKLICPNCNQNLLINKKYLKLRAKPNKIQIESNKVKIINLNINKNKNININEEKDIKNNNNINITSKNIENENNNINNKESLIIIKKRKKDEKDKNNKNKNNIKEINIKDINTDKNENIYNPKNDLEYKNTEIIHNQENEIDAKYINIKKENKNLKDKKIIFGKIENEKNDISSNIKESIIKLNVQKFQKP